MMHTSAFASMPIFPSWSLLQLESSLSHVYVASGMLLRVLQNVLRVIKSVHAAIHYSLSKSWENLSHAWHNKVSYSDIMSKMSSNNPSTPRLTLAFYLLINTKRFTNMIMTWSHEFTVPTCCFDLKHGSQFNRWLACPLHHVVLSLCIPFKCARFFCCPSAAFPMSFLFRLWSCFLTLLIRICRRKIIFKRDFFTKALSARWKDSICATGPV